jgi:RNA polymerase sigma factor (sigma-70 family)
MASADALVGNFENVDRRTLEREFDRVIAAHGAALSRLAASYTHTLSDRDDLLQDIAIAIWLALPGFRGECSERTFVFRIAHNRAITHLARMRAHSPATEEPEPRDPSPDPEAGLAQEQRAAALRSAIRQLPLIYRQPVTLLLEGLTYGEIAEVLGISENNVGARLTRGRQMLRDFLEGFK